jgi:hypothetical protein
MGSGEKPEIMPQPKPDSGPKIANSQPATSWNQNTVDQFKGEAKEAIELGLERWWAYDSLKMGDLPQYLPWRRSRAHETVGHAYQAMLMMPSQWSELIEITEKLQSPEQLDKIYQELRKRDTRERSWCSCKRTPGVLGFLFSSCYIRPKDGYPRIFPQGRSVSRLGLQSSEGY